MMTAAAVIGSHYGDRNLGDAAIAGVVAYALEARGYGSVRVFVIRGGVEGGGPRPLNLRSIQAWCSLVHRRTRPKMVVVGGGGILQNSTSLANLLVHFLSVVIGRLVGARVVLAGIGVGPLMGRFAPRLAGWTVRLATGGCLVRDSESQKFCERWSRSPVRCAPDLAFALPLTLPEKAGINGPACGGDRLVLSLRPPVGSRRTRMAPDEQYLNGLKKVVDTAMGFARSTNRSLVFLPTHPVQDVALWGRLCDQNPEFHKISCISAASAEGLLGAIRAGDLVVGMRLHSIIFAVMAGASFVALGYDEKVDALARSLGQEAQLVGMRHGRVDSQELKSALQRASTKGPALSDQGAQLGVQALSALGELLEDK